MRQPNGLTFAIPAPEDTQAVKIMVLPPAPSSIDLLAASDTGASNSDNITKASPMEFTVAGVTSGATVRLKAGTTILDEAVVAAGETSVTITTTKVADLGNGKHLITATQVIDGVESLVSPGLDVTFDNAIPQLITSGILLSAIVGQPYVVDLAHPEEGAGISYSLIDFPTGMSIDSATGLITWTPASNQVADRS